jgi:ubiquinone/menaquinone biosynthesis C-methylase UbiE
MSKLTPILLAKAVLVAGALFLFAAGLLGSSLALLALHAVVILAAVLFLLLRGVRREEVRGGMHQREGDRHAGIVLHGAAAYDVLAKLFTLGREGRFRQAMLDRARLNPGETVLDVGCGTGTLAITAKKNVGEHGSVVGLDASREMIERARSKAARAGVDVEFVHGTAQDLPLPDTSVDCVLGTLMLHHLSKPARVEFFREARRVLKPGGRFVLIDFGRPEKRSRALHFHRHGHVDMQAIADVLAAAEFTVVETGSLGIRDIHFLEATPGSPATAHAHPARPGLTVP